MNISTHLLIDAGILSTSLTIILVLRAKGNAARKDRGTKWEELMFNLERLINLYNLIEKNLHAIIDILNNEIRILQLIISQILIV